MIKYFIVLFGKNFLNLLYSCFVNVLLWVMISVGLFIFWIMLDMVKVFFVLVVLSKVWCFKFFFNFVINCFIVLGWFFCGLYLEINLNLFFNLDFFYFLLVWFWYLKSFICEKFSKVKSGFFRFVNVFILL